MRLRPALLLAAALLPAPVLAQSSPATAAVKPIAFTERTLANGLRVYALRDTTTPNVSVQVWYDVGSKDDPRGRSGFAHLFEHLMFKATRNLVPEQMDRLTEDVGGFNNASTNDDYTEYHETIPANHLQRLLFAEGDRMASLVVEPVTFASERDVVKEELRQSTLARPYGKLFSTYLSAASYTVHPYARSTIGSIAELDSAGIDDVRAFHATYYRPDNAILVVSGNFDSAQLNAWVDRYFAPIERPAGAIPRVTATEPERTKAVSYTVHEPNTPLPAVMMSWHVPPDDDADIPALSVLQTVLATGESSRLYEDVVYRDQLAQDAAAFLDTKKGTGNLIVYAILAGGKTVAQGEAALAAEIATFRDAPVTAAELAEAKNQVLTSAIRGRETAEGKARILASSVIIDGDPHAADRQLAAIARVTAADVQRVARRYLRPEQGVTIRYLPATPAAATTQASTPIAVAATVQTAALVPPASIPVVTPATAAERIAPPPPAGPVPATLPQPVETRLANGLRVVTVERHALPLVTASLVASGGGATDPASRAGAAELAATLMTKGTATRSATQIARAVEALGGSIASNADRDGDSVTLTVKSDQLNKAMPILADVAQHPAFAPAEIERARTQSIDAVTVSLQDPAQLAALVASRAVFGSGPYAAPLGGTPDSLKAITRDDIARSYVGTWSPDRAALVMVGDITPAAARALAEAQFGGWKPTPPPPAITLAPPPPPRVVVIDMPDAGQAGVVVARPAIMRSDARYYPLVLGNTVLGGGFSSRLNQEIRIKRGLAYGAGSSLSARRLSGIVAARTQTKNPTADEAVALIAAEMARMGTTPVPPAELDTRKAVLIGGFGRTVETTDGIADLIGDYVIQDVPLAELGRFTAKVAAVDPAAVQAAAATWLDPRGASIVVVGDAKQFVEPLRAAYPTLQVIPAATLDLDTGARRTGAPPIR